MTDTAPNESASGARGAARASRRSFLLTGLGVLLAGCAAPEEAARRLPGPAWDMRPEPLGPAPVIEPPSAIDTPFPGEMISRARWATGRPVPGLMQRMKPIRYVTVHHDGMQPFYADDARSAADRLDAIRRAHRNQDWGDIGYHFAVDRAGNVWEGRPLRYQGAHVKDHNEGNVGVVALGNFDQQHPTEAQLAALRHHVGLLMRIYDVPVSRVRTHQEWQATACPGRSLQRYMVYARGNGAFA